MCSSLMGPCKLHAALWVNVPTTINCISPVIKKITWPGTRVVLCLVMVYMRSFVRSFPHATAGI